jgi:hypothetical protein
MHTALVSRLLRDHSLWEETTLSDEVHESGASSEVATEQVL